MQSSPTKNGPPEIIEMGHPLDHHSSSHISNQSTVGDGGGHNASPSPPPPPSPPSPSHNHHLHHHHNHDSHPHSEPRPPHRKKRSTLLRDTSLGLADGLTVPFALTAGLSSLGSSRLVILGGLAELFSGAISMGLGAYLAAATEQKQYEVAEARAQKEVEALGTAAAGQEMQVRAGDVEAGLGVVEAEVRGQREREREVRVEEKTYRVLAGYGISPGAGRGVVEELRRRPEEWVNFMMAFELRLEKPKTSQNWMSALAMGSSYFIGGLIPMIPYFASHNVNFALFLSIGITAAILLLFGFAKAKAMGTTKIAALWSALHTLVVGALAAGASYGIVRAVNSAKGL